MSNSSNQVTRLLALVPYLLRHPGAEVKAVASEFSVTPRQLRDDLKVLQWCGLPQLNYGDYIEIDLDAVDGAGVINLSNADYFARPLRFTPDEAVALLLALRSLRELAGPEQIAVIDTAAAKLSALAGESGRVAEQTVLRVHAGAEEIRSVIHRALREQVRVQLTYDSATRAETTHRAVDPLRVSVRDGYAYLDAWCHTAQALRSFRMDRIVEATSSDIPSDDHTDVVLPDPADRWFAGLDDAPLVTVRLAPSAQWVAEYMPTEAVGAPDTEDNVSVTFRVAHPAWLAALLLRLGDRAQVVEPAGAADEARFTAEQTLAMYAERAERAGFQDADAPGRHGGVAEGTG